MPTKVSDQGNVTVTSLSGFTERICTSCKARMFSKGKHGETLCWRCRRGKS